MLIAAWEYNKKIDYHETNVAQRQVIMLRGEENSNVDPLIGVAPNPFFEITAVMAFFLTACFRACAQCGICLISLA